jgi:hypothetical protein
MVATGVHCRSGTPWWSRMSAADTLSGAIIATNIWCRPFTSCHMVTGVCCKPVLSHHGKHWCVMHFSSHAWFSLFCNGCAFMLIQFLCGYIMLMWGVLPVFWRYMLPPCSGSKCRVGEFLSMCLYIDLCLRNDNCNWGLVPHQGQQGHWAVKVMIGLKWPF